MKDSDRYWALSQAAFHLGCITKSSERMAAALRLFRKYSHMRKQALSREMRSNSARENKL